MKNDEFVRSDGRKFNELRKIEAKVGVIPNADGSAFFKIGKTTAYVAVYGPRGLHPKFLQDPKTGKLRCFYNMMPFSGMGDRVRPGGSRRSKDISLIMEKALLPVLDLTDYPNAVVDVFAELSETDAGTRCAAICAAAMALADAGIKMKDMVSAVAIGKLGDQMVMDPNYEEEAFDGPKADVPIAMIHGTKEISSLQMDGELSKEELANALELAKEANEIIYQVQRKALLERFEGGEEK